MRVATALGTSTGLLVWGQAQTTLRGNAFRLGTLHFWLGIGLSAVVIVKGASIALGIVAMLVVEWLATDEPQLPPILIFGLTALTGFAIAVRIYRGIDTSQPSAAAPVARPLPV